MYARLEYHVFMAGKMDEQLQLQLPHEQQKQEQQTRDVAAWAQPAYERTWQDYCAAGAPFGHTHDGMMRWVVEQVQRQREAYERGQKGR